MTAPTPEEIAELVKLLDRPPVLREEIHRAARALESLSAQLRENDDTILQLGRNGVEALEMVARRTEQVDQLRAELREALEGNAALRELLETARRERDFAHVALKAVARGAKGV
jgi:uncharacterized protein (DUF1778 family)